VSGSQITFLPSSGTLSSSDSIDFILILGSVNDVGVATTVSDSAITKSKLNLISTSGSPGLEVKGDGSSENGTIQLNCSQNSHGVKISSPAHSAGQSYELILPTGNVTADKVLKVASVSGSGTTGIGQLSFGDAGGLVKLTSAAISSATSFSITSTHITSTYKFYDLVIEGSTPSGNNDWFAYLQTSTNNGSSYDSGSTSYKWTTLNTGTQGSFSSVYDQNGDTSLRLISAASDILDFTTTIRMFSPTDSTKYTNFVGSGMGGHQSNDDAKPAFFIGVNRVHQAVNNIKVTFSTAFTGNYYFYGVVA
jgi:hypothetical protein